jgi:hypothetical protein
MGRFDRIISLWGISRSGTTTIALANHSRVRAIIQPYQRRPELQDAESSVAQLRADYWRAEASEAARCSLRRTTRDNEREVNIVPVQKTSCRIAIAMVQAGYP